MDINYSAKLLTITRRFHGTVYQPLVEQASEAYVAGNYKMIDEIEKKLPTEYQMLETLVEKLKKKSVYANLRKIIKGESVDKAQHAIALSSLLTHCLIEMKDKLEYKVLAKSLSDKLAGLV